MNQKIKFILRGIRSFLVFIGGIGIMFIQFYGFMSLLKGVSYLPEQGSIDRIISWLILIGTPLAYYDFLKAVLSNYTSKD